LLRTHDERRKQCRAG